MFFSVNHVNLSLFVCEKFVSLLNSFTDLSTLASVVTTLASMGKNKGDPSPRSPVSERSTPNGHLITEGGTDSVAKAFDTMAKMVQPSTSLNLSQVRIIIFTVIYDIRSQTNASTKCRKMCQPFYCCLFIFFSR